jgi:flagellin
MEEPGGGRISNLELMMGAYLYTNTASLSAQRGLQKSQELLKQNTERLSSGKRVNSARDDAAGVGIAKRFEGNVQGIRQGVRNANDGQAMAIAGESVLEQMAQMALRIREVAVQSANGTYATSDRKNLDSEVQSLVSQIQDLAKNSKYNGSTLLGGQFSKAIQYSDETTGQFTIKQSIALTNVSALAGAFNVTQNDKAMTTIKGVDSLLSKIASARSNFGKAAVRLGYVAEAQASLAEAIDGARSRIEDTDYAQETAAMTRNQILQQAATAALAQANAMPNVILSLIK